MQLSGVTDKNDLHKVPLELKLVPLICLHCDKQTTFLYVLLCTDNGATRVP